MKHSDFNRLIKVRKATTANSEYNTPIETFADFKTFWASRRDMSTAEKLSTGQVNAVNVTQFIVHASTDSRTIDANDQITHDGATWSVLGVKEKDEGFRRYLEITASRQAD